MAASILSNPGFVMTYAVVQAVVVLLLVRFLDLYEREPLSVLALMALWGATGAAALSLLGNETFDSLLSGDAHDVFATAVSPPLVEEVAKGIALVVAVFSFRWLGRRLGVARFDGLTDGIVYGAAVGLGFAFTEDFFYFLNRARGEGLEAGLDIFEGRRDFFGPAVFHHALFTAAFGAGLGLATWARRWTVALSFAAAGFAVAVLMHAANNGLVELVLTHRYGLTATAAWTRGEPVPAGVISTADNVQIALRLLDYAYLIAFLAAVAVWLRYQRRVIRSELLEEAESGLVTRDDWNLVSRYRDRSGRYWRLLRAGEFEQWRILRRLHVALVELALLKWRLRRYGGDWGAVQRARQMIATLASSDARPSNLPAQLGPLIGRQNELEEIVALLRGSETRFVTLTGPGGVGKTRLGLHAAERLRDSFASGVFFVPRVAEPDPSLLLPAVANVLGVAELGGGDSLLERLRDFLRDKHLLLVIDSFEQTIASGPAIADLLSSARRLKVLATSRQPIRVSVEREYPVKPLSIPPEDVGVTSEAGRKYGAVELFVERAKAVSPSFELTAANARAVAEICRHLEGLPLAIDLAAARSRLLPPESILEQLRDPLAFLTAGERDFTMRHQTLRATIDWSYRLLEPEEQRLFARLAVFAGGCTLEAAETVCGEGRPRSGILDAISSLVEQNLLQSLGGAAVEPRFGMLETIRQYALERLGAGGELPKIRAAHADYFLAFAQGAEPQLMGAEQVLWGRRLDEEYQNFRAVLSWALVPDRVERLSGVLRQTEDGRLLPVPSSRSLQVGVRLSEALEPIWEQRGHLTEARRWLEAALEAGVDLPPDVRGRALLRTGRLAELQSDYTVATEALDESVVLLRSQGDGRGVAWAHLELGWVALVRADYDRSETLLADGLALARDERDMRLSASLLDCLGRVLLERGTVAGARERVASGLAMRETAGDKRDIAASLTTLGRLELITGALQAAVHALDTALSLSRDVGAKLRLSGALYQRSLVALELDDVRLANELLQERLLLCRELGDRLGFAEAVDALAQLRGRESDDIAAVRLASAAQRMRNVLSAEQWGFERSRSDALIAATQSRDEPSFAAAWAAGAAMSMEDVFRAASAPSAAPQPRQFSQPIVAV